MKGMMKRRMVHPAEAKQAWVELPEVGAVCVRNKCSENLCVILSLQRDRALRRSQISHAGYETEQLQALSVGKPKCFLIYHCSFEAASAAVSSDLLSHSQGPTLGRAELLFRLY